MREGFWIVAAIGFALSVVALGAVSPPLYHYVFWIAVALWLSYLPFAVRFSVDILKGARRYIYSIHGDEAFDVSDPVIFQFTTRNVKNCYSTLLSAIHSVISSCREAGLQHFEIEVVTDSNDGIELLQTIEAVEVVVVPEEYVIKGAIRKARSLQYAVEYRRRCGKNTKNYWIFHLDEESHISAQTVKAIQNFISQGKCLIGTGPIFYPNRFSKASPLTRYAESIRPSGCYICCSQKMPIHMHGSNLLVRADVEDAVGWANGETVAEDQLFGLKVYEKYGAVFGWHGGIIYEQPPLKVNDMLKQRKRWFLGVWSNLKKFNLKTKAEVVLGLATWALGFASATLSIPYWTITLMAVPNFFFPQLPLEIPFYHHTPILTPIEILVDTLQGDIGKYLKPSYLTAWVYGLLLSISFFTWVGTYIIGLYWNTKYIKASLPTKIRWHAQQLLLLPIVGLLETSAAFLAVKEIIKGKYSHWEITPK